MKEDASGTKGHCFKCDDEGLDYGILTVQDEWIYYPYVCEFCGFKGREFYSPKFSFHTSEA